MRSRPVIAGLLVLVVLAGVAMAATGDTQDVAAIDDFEDGDTSVDRPEWTGWSDPDGVFSTTSSAISGTFSGGYVPDSNDGNQPVAVTRSSNTTDWLNFSASVDGESGSSVTHEFRVRSGGTELMTIEYDENSSDQYGNLEVKRSGGQTKIGEWTEDASGVQDWAIDFDFGADEATVFRNGSDQGTFSLKSSANGWDEFEIETETTARTVDDTLVTVDDVGATTTVADPHVDNASASPTGALSNKDQTLSINVSDPDFAEPHDDEVAVEFYKDGSLIDTQTISTNQTVDTTTTFIVGGDHTWHIETEDAYGGTTRSQNFTVTVPSNLDIRNESAPDTLVTPDEVELRFFGRNGTIINRTTTSGSLDLSGLPVGEDFVVRVKADGYHSRTTVIKSIYDTQSVYLLNTSYAFYEKVFTLTDPTGRYPNQDTALFVERTLNQSNSLEWRTVAGDVFGPQGVVADLKQDERYRLVIENLETGDRAVLGQFQPVASGTTELKPSSATVNLSDSRVPFAYRAEMNRSASQIDIDYIDMADATDTLTIRIHERNNESNVLLANTTFTNLGNLSYAEPLTASERNTSWVVEFYIDRGGGTQYAQVPVGQGPRDLVPDLLDAVWRTSIGVLALLTTALLFSQLNTGVGAVTTALVGAVLWYIGLLSDITTGPAVVFALAVAGLVWYNQNDVGGVPT